jgi:type VI secretion system protein ImpH
MSKRPSQNVVDLAHVPALGFAARTVESVEIVRGRATLRGHWLGLTGPMGPLPIHLTEFTFFERRYARSQPFGEFLNLLSGRMLQLFYRAWGESQPCVQADRVDDDRFAFYIGAVSGATEGVGEGAAMPARARLHYAALFASRRSPVAVEDALTYLLGAPVGLAEYQPRWREIEPEDRTCLGGKYATVGFDAVLGRRVRLVTDAFRVFVRAGSLAAYERLLPSGDLFPVACEALVAFAPSHLEWDIAVELDEAHAFPARLDGRARLGWSSWLAPRGSGGIRSDAHLRRTSRPHRRSRKGLL